MIYQLQFHMDSKGHIPLKQTVERTIEAAGSCRLEQLMETLLESLHFDFDHMYAFYDGKREYSGAPPYAPYDQRCKAKVLKLGLKEGDRLDAVYDFGDEWAFDIQVLEVRNERGGEPRVISATGEIEQYPEESQIAESADQPLQEEEEFYVVSDELFDAAFRYKQTKLWKQISETEVFALRFSDGQTGFVSVMGQAGEHCALGVYVGENAFNSYRRLRFDLSEDEPMSNFEFSLQQDCLQIVFDVKDSLLEGELAAVRAYAQPRGIRFQGKNAFPAFKKYIPGRIPWHVEDPKDERYLIEAAEAAIRLAETLGGGLPGQIGIWEHQLTDREVPCIRTDITPDPLNAMNILGEPVRIGALPPRKWPVPSDIPGAQKKRLRRYKAKGEWECRIALLEGSIEDTKHPELHSYFPLVLVMMNRTNESVFRPFLADGPQLDPDKVRDHVLDRIEEIRRKPEAFIAADERTRALIEPIAQQLDCAFRMEEDLPLLDEMLLRLNLRLFEDEEMGDELLDPEEYDELIEMAAEIASLPASTFATLDPEVRRDLLDLIDSGVLPAHVEQQLRKKMRVQRRK